MKWVLGILGVILLIGFIGGIYVYNSFFKAMPLATLVIENGNAQYSTGGDWKSARNGMELKQGYSVKTSDNSLANIIFSDSVMRLDSNTEVKIDSLDQNSVSLMQTIGKTWSRLLKISGISSYEVNTPEAIASVRGTGFAVYYDGNRTQIKVSEGIVNVKSGGTSSDVDESNQAEVDKQGNLKKEALSEDDWISKNKNLDDEHKAQIKARIMSKYGMIINVVKSKYGLTDDQLNQMFEDWFSGKTSVKKSIEDGTIPSEAASLIPAEFKRY